MRGSVAIILLVTTLQAAFWGILRFSDSDPDYWKYAAIALLVGIFLSLPILSVKNRTYATLFFAAVIANAVGGVLVAAASHIGHFDFSDVATSAIPFVAALLVPLAAIVFIKFETVATFLYGPESRTIIAMRRIVKRINRAPQSDAVSENYAFDMSSQSISAGCGLLVLGLIATYLLEFSTAILSIFLGIAVFGHIGLTNLRVRNGSFGSNAQEAEEIISYILDHHQKTGLPPGGRLSTVSTVHDAIGAMNVGSSVRGEI